MGENINKTKDILNEINIKLNDIDNKYNDDVDKLVKFNIIKNRLLAYTLALGDNRLILNRKLKENELISVEINKFMVEINNKINRIQSRLDDEYPFI